MRTNKPRIPRENLRKPGSDRRVSPDRRHDERRMAVRPNHVEPRSRQEMREGERRKS